MPMLSIIDLMVPLAPFAPVVSLTIELAAGSRVPMLPASARLANNRQIKTNQGLVPSALKKIRRICFMKAEHYRVGFANSSLAHIGQGSSSSP